MSFVTKLVRDLCGITKVDLRDMTRQVALALHGWGGDSAAFIDALKTKGFEIAAIQWDGNECILAAVRPDA